MHQVLGLCLTRITIDGRQRCAPGFNVLTQLIPVYTRFVIGYIVTPRNVLGNSVPELVKNEAKHGVNISLYFGHVRNTIKLRSLFLSLSCCTLLKNSDRYLKLKEKR